MRDSVALDLRADGETEQITKIGPQMPSLSPLSTFNNSSVAAGTVWFVTIGLPSAASVGASIVASELQYVETRADQPSHTEPEQDRQRQPEQQQSLRELEIPANHAKIGFGGMVNSTIASVASASRRKPSTAMSRCRALNPVGPRTRSALPSREGSIIVVRLVYFLVVGPRVKPCA